ncbi:MAG: hypothetical protein HN509_02390, partial [Halobacteriovoraceae bacterium]|nr:hypothetical protein [Halobacteriovoraceae bacterium]
IPFSIRIPKIHAAVSLPYLDGEVAKGWQAALENADRVDEIKGETSLDRDAVIRSIRSVVRKNPRFEAMALKVPILASKVSGHVDLLLRENLFERDNTSEYCRKIQSSFLTKNIEMNHRRILDDFDLEKNFSELIKNY